jgi:hypothetical protein
MSVLLSAFRHSVLENGSVSIIRSEGGEYATHLGPLYGASYIPWSVIKVSSF